jgi:hypothetical protein
MPWQFSKHYTRQEARALLPQIRDWLAQLIQSRKELEESDRQMSVRLAQGCDLGGQPVTHWVRLLAQIKELVEQFSRREIEIKDLERGLIDFPAIIGGKEVFLCWEKDEDDIEFWHDLNTGYTGRERLEED